MCLSVAEDAEDTMSEKEAMERMAVYYQQFHHTCVTWYITIMGFFIAGLLAGPEPTPKTQFLWIPVLVFSLLFFAAFFYYLFHYGARIKWLNERIEEKVTPIPADWRSVHKGVGLEIHGAGSAFFMIILLAMQVALVSLLALRYWT
jgi:hypothetical protein